MARARIIKTTVGAIRNYGSGVGNYYYFGRDNLASKREMKQIYKRISAHGMYVFFGKMAQKSLDDHKYRAKRKLDPNYNKWESLKDSTIEKKKRMDLGPGVRPGSIMQESGETLKAVKIIHVNQYGFRIGIEDGTDEAYKEYYNSTYDAKWKRAARPFVGVGDKLEQEMFEEFTTMIDMALDGMWDNV